jgi:hypothetical protein
MTVLVYHAMALGSLCRSLSEQILQYKTTKLKNLESYYLNTTLNSSHLVLWIRSGFFRPIQSFLYPDPAPDPTLKLCQVKNMFAGKDLDPTSLNSSGSD